jgi:hypothetical protein
VAKNSKKGKTQMKKIIVISAITLISAIASAKNCIPHITYLYQSRGNKVISNNLVSTDGIVSILNVRGTYYSGDFLEEVTADTKTCKFISRKIIWSE